jgi:hypothetical protein
MAAGRRPALASSDTVKVSLVPYATLKLLLLSLLWRAQVSTLAPFKSVRLGRQSERIRAMLLADDPGPAISFPVSGIALRNPDSGEFEDSLLHFPAVARKEGYYLHRMVCAGVLWYVGTSSHTPPAAVPLALAESGELTLLVQDWTSIRLFRELRGQMRAAASRQSHKPGRGAV